MQCVANIDSKTTVGRIQPFNQRDHDYSTVEKPQRVKRGL